MRIARVSFLLAVLGIVVLATVAIAHESDDFDARLITDKWHVSVGGYLVDVETSAEMGFGGLLGTLIRLEDDLKIDDDKVTARFSASYRWRPKHTFLASYFLLDRRGTTSVDSRIKFLDYEFDVGAELKSKFSTKILAAGYRYSFVNTGRTEAGMAFGLGLYDFDLGLQGVGTAVGDTSSVSGEFVNVEGSFLAPVPTIGIFLDHGFTENLIFRSGATFLDLRIGDYAGRVVDTHLLLEYFFWQGLGVMFGGSGTDIAIENGGPKPFRITYRQSGLIIALSYGHR